MMAEYFGEGSCIIVKVYAFINVNTGIYNKEQTSGNI